MRPFDDINRLERAEWLDRPAAAARSLVQRVLRHQGLKDALHGVWLGHPFHPGAAQFTLGSLTSAALIDAVRGPRSGSTGLIAAGLASALPTAVSGWADFADAHEDQQRVGIVHAASNGTAIALFVAALFARARGRSGRLASVAGGVVAGIGAVLGGHLGYRQALGANHAEDVTHIGPADWQPLGPIGDIPEYEPVRRHIGLVDVVVVRHGATVTVLADRCPHLSAPLSEGRLIGVDGRERGRPDRVSLARFPVPARRRVRRPRARDGVRAAFRDADHRPERRGAGRADSRGGRPARGARRRPAARPDRRQQHRHRRAPARRRPGPLMPRGSDGPPEANGQAIRAGLAAVQAALLPRAVPVLPRVAVGARYLLADLDSTAGGDWYDAVVRPDGSLGLVVGDVVGHGFAASAVMGQLRAVTRHCLDASASPSAVVTAVVTAVDRFARRLPGAHTATICVAVLEADHRVTPLLHRGPSTPAVGHDERPALPHVPARRTARDRRDPRGGGRLDGRGRPPAAVHRRDHRPPGADPAQAHADLADVATIVAARWEYSEDSVAAQRGCDEAIDLLTATGYGPVDAACAVELRDHLRSATRNGTMSRAVDLSRVTLLASDAVRVLHEARSLSVAHHEHLDLLAPPGCPAHHVLELVGLHPADRP